MENYKIGIIICYFGNLPDYFPLWRRSCELNKDFDFIIITDQKIDSSENIHVYNLKFEELVEKIKSKLNTEIKLLTPYKLCDFKCMYGVIFSEILSQYDFWGMCDMDMVFGNLSNFIRNDILDKYDKIYQLGHLTLYRNTNIVNNSFKLDGWMNWEEVVNTPYHCRLCERGMMKKYTLAGIPVYDKRDYADINKVHRQFQLSKWLVPKKTKINYMIQVFIWENGHTYRYYYDKTIRKIRKQEFTYIHFQKRKMKKVGFSIDDVDSYFITQNKFIENKDIKLTPTKIFLLNPYYGKIYELYECIKYEIKKRYRNRLYNIRIKRIDQK